MKITLIFLVFLSAFVTQEPLKPMRLTLKVTDSRYCVGDDEIDRLQLKLRFVYENRTGGPVILYKLPAEPTRVMIARTLADAAALQYEIDFTQTWYSDKPNDEASACFKDAAPGNCFVTVAHGSSYEIDGDVRVFAVRGDVKDVPGAVKSGEHALQLVLPTWTESAKLAQELNSRWRSHGTLWTKPLTSDPLTFTIDKERKVVACD